jgi:hypothetical protein
MNKLRITILLILSAFTMMLAGQNYEVSKQGSKISVKGTSTVHDWDMNLADFRSGFILITDGKQVNGINNVSFSCKVTDLKSESSMMNRKTYDALNSKQFSEISFNGASTEGFSMQGEKISGNVKGKLSIAGVARDVTFPFTGTYRNNQISVTGSVPVSLKDFNIDPPTAMLGSLKTGDKITVSFSLNYIPGR